jgi:tetratricopeptide (TPR) repeat protein
MFHFAFLALLATGLAPDDAGGQKAADRKTYEAVRLKAGHDPAALVKLSLWCEAHGLTAERGKHLMEAVGVDPANAAARGLLGLISYRGNWLRPQDVGVKRKSDKDLMTKLEAYHARRAELDASLRTKTHAAGGRHKAALAHEKLGTWCEEQGLKDEAIAHFTTAVQYDPYLDVPWKHLGYVKHHGQWMTREKIAAAEQEATAQRKADRHWDALLRRWKADLGDKKRRNQAEESLASVTDPRAVPAIMRTFAKTQPVDQTRAVSMLDQVEGPTASLDLARLAVFGDLDETREQAIAALKKREPRDYVGLLIELVRFPVKFKVQPVTGPGSRGGLLIDTPRYKLLRTYDAPPAFELASTFRGVITYDADGMPVPYRGIELDTMGSLKPALQLARQVEVNLRAREFMAEANLKAAAAGQQLAADVGALEQFNFQASAINERVLPVLQETAAAPVADADPDTLNKWWYDRLGYSYQPPEQVQVAQNAFPQIPPPRLTTCFAAGTPVRTLDGFQPIEKICTGDLVLSQDVTTGELDFRPILVVHHNPPNRTLRIVLADDEILVASVYHRFWRSGKGWAQARELQAGDILRTLGSTVRVVSVEPGSIVPLFNLDVSRNRSFFVGNGNVLVHDNTLPPARHALFDEPPSLVAVPTAGTP